MRAILVGLSHQYSPLPPLATPLSLCSVCVCLSDSQTTGGLRLPPGQALKRRCCCQGQSDAAKNELFSFSVFVFRLCSCNLQLCKHFQ